MTDTYTTREAADLLGLAVRSVQLMADRGELQAWKTPGGHRRISHASVQDWRQRHGAGPLPGPGSAAASAPPLASTPLPTTSVPAPALGQRVLLIEDSRHFQNLVALLLRQHFPQLELHVADDGIAGLAMAGRLQPALLLVDILLPGIDGATLITSLRSHAQFADTQLIVLTSLDEAQREPYAFALQGVPVVHKPRLVVDLPPLLRRQLAARRAAPAA